MLESRIHLPLCHFADNHITALPDELWELPELHTLDLRNNDLNSLPCTLGFSKSLVRCTLEGNPLRTMRRSLVSGSVEALKAFLRSRATPELAAACEHQLAARSNMPGTSAAAQQDLYTAAPAGQQDEGRFSAAGAAHSGAQYSAVEDVRNALSEGTLDLAGRGLREVPSMIWRHIKESTQAAQDAIKAAQEGRRIGPDGSVLSGGALVFGSKRSGYAGRDVQPRGAEAITTVNLNDNALPDSGNGDTEHILPSDCAARLPNLAALLLRNCQMTLLPPCIGQFQQLRVLDLSGSRVRWEAIDGALMQPDQQLGMAPAPACGALRELRAASCGLQRLPSSLAFLDRLETLDLSNNGLEVEEDIDDELFLLPALRICDLRGNRLTHIPHTLMSLPRLTQLNLDNNELRSIPAALSTATQLKTLSLHGNPTRSIRPALLMQSCPQIMAYLASRLEPHDAEAARVEVLRSELQHKIALREAEDRSQASAAAAAAADAAYEGSIAPKIGSGAVAHSQVRRAPPPEQHHSHEQQQRGFPQHAIGGQSSHAAFASGQYSDVPTHSAPDLGRFRASEDTGGYVEPERGVGMTMRQPGSHVQHSASYNASQPMASAAGSAPPSQQQQAPPPASTWSEQELMRKMTQVEGQLDSGGASKAKVFALKKELARLRADLLKLRRTGR